MGRQYSACPYGFQIPEGDDSRLIFFNDTNCAYGCMSNFYTIAQWGRKADYTAAFGRTGFALSSLFVLLWILDSERRRQHLIITLGLFTWMTSLATIITTGQTWVEMFCETLSIPKDMSIGASTCTVQAGLLQVGSLGTSCAWVSQAIDLFLKIVMEKNTTTRDYGFGFLAFNLTLPLFSILWLLIGGHLGYSRGYSYCFLNSDAPFYIYFVTIGGPLLLIAIVGIACMFTVMQKIARTSLKTQKGTDSVNDAAKTALATLNLLKTLKIPILFCILFLILSLSVIVQLLQVALIRDTVVAPSTAQFDECVFAHWDGIDDTSWRAPCGDKQSIGYKANNWLLFCVTGQSIFISMIFLPFALTKLPSDVKQLLVYLKLMEDKSDDNRRRRYSRKKKRDSTVAAGADVETSTYSNSMTSYSAHEGSYIENSENSVSMITSMADNISRIVSVPRESVIATLKIYSRDSSEKVYPSTRIANADDIGDTLKNEEEGE